MTYPPATPLQPQLVPDTAVFRRRFPEFGATTDDIVGFAIEEALLFTNGWTSPGAPLATIYLAAHIVAAQKIASEANGRMITAEQLGRISVKFTGLPSGILLGDVGSTVYGRRYQQLQGLGIKQFQSIRDGSRRNAFLYSFYWGWP